MDDGPTAQELSEDVLRRFILLYETLPELWNTAIPEYTNKYRKIEAYGKLVEVYKEIKPNATDCDVKKQINALRSNYRRELRKVEASQGVATTPNEVYQPKSWKFYALSFLQGEEKPTIFIKQENYEPQEPYDYPEESYVSPQSPVTTPVSWSSPEQPPRKRAKNIGSKAKQTGNLQLLCDYICAEVGSPRQESNKDFLNVAKVWARKLENLKPMQRKLAEKAVNDILFEADMGSLRRDSVHINCGHSAMASSCNYTASAQPNTENSCITVNIPALSPEAGLNPGQTSHTLAGSNTSAKTTEDTDEREARH